MNARQDKMLADLDRLCTEFGIPPVPPPPPPKRFSPAPGIDCYCCDYRRLPVKQGSVDAICTDIPWASDWLPNVEEFAEWCAKVLKRGDHGDLVRGFGARPPHGEARHALVLPVDVHLAERRRDADQVEVHPGSVYAVPHLQQRA